MSKNPRKSSSVTLSSLADITRKVSKLTAQADIDFTKEMSRFNREADKADAISSLLASMGDRGVNDSEVDRLMQQVQSEVNIDKSLQRALGDNKEVKLRISSVKTREAQQGKRASPEEDLEGRLAKLQNKSVKDIQSRVEEIESEQKRKREAEEKETVTTRKGIFEDLDLNLKLEESREKDRTDKDKGASKAKPLSTEEKLIASHIDGLKTLATVAAIDPATSPDTQNAMLNYANKLSAMEGIAKTAMSAPMKERPKIWGVIVKGLESIMKPLQRLSSVVVSALRTVGNKSVEHLKSVTTAQSDDKKLLTAKNALMEQYKARAQLEGLTDKQTTSFLKQCSADVQKMTSHKGVCQGIYDATKQVRAAGREAILKGRRELMSKRAVRSRKSKISPGYTPPVVGKQNKIER